MLAEVLIGDDPGDLTTARRAPLRLLEVAAAAPPVRPTVAVLHLAPGSLAPEPDMAAAMAEVEAVLADAAFALALPSLFDEALAARERINLAEMAKCYHPHERRGAALMSETLASALERGRAIPARDYLAALDWPRVLNSALDTIFERCDAIVTPAAPGPAPGRETTGSAIFNALWSLCGVPAVTLPLLTSSRVCRWASKSSAGAATMPAYFARRAGSGPRSPPPKEFPMLDRVTSIAALVVLVGFLGILAWKLQRLDLTLVVGLTVALAAWDALGRR
jgi:hypothetical protein